MPVNEQLTFSVSFGGVVKASASATINDTSRPAYDYSLVASNPSSTPITSSSVPTYIITSNVSSASEGSTVTFTLTTTKLDTGTSVPWTVTGISAADLSSGSMTGTFVTDSAGKATATFILANDSLTEGTESMVLSLNGRSEFKEVDILDTSKAPTYALGWYSDTAGNVPISSTNEGDVIYLVAKTTSVTNGTVIAVTLNGTGITSSDFVKGALSFNMTVNSNIAYSDLTTVMDVLTEGNETAVATGFVSGTNIGSASLVIVDTSKAPEYVATPNGTYHHKSGPSEFVIAPNTTKRITLYPAGPAPVNDDYDGASGGITGLYIPNGETFQWGVYDVSAFAGMGLKGAVAAFGAYALNGDRGNGPANNNIYNGYWEWGAVTDNATVGETGIVDGLRLTIETVLVSTLRIYTSGDGSQGYAKIVTVLLENTNSVPKTLYTMYGEEARGGGTGMSGTGDGSHGGQGGVLAHGVPDINYVDRAFKQTWTSGGTFVADGYMVVSD